MSTPYSLLLAFDPQPLHDAAKNWRGLAQAVQAATTQQRAKVHAPLLNSWKGNDAQAAFAFMENTEEQFGLVQSNAEGAAVVMDTIADRIYQAQTNLTNAVQRAQQAGLTVGDDGTIQQPPRTGMDHHDPDAEAAYQALDNTRGDIQGRINTALKDAQDASDQGAKALGDLHPDFLTQNTPYALDVASGNASNALAEINYTGAMPDGKDPQQNATWWKGLTPDQQQAYISLYPSAVGAMDGLPTVARDEANRLVLDRKIDEARYDTGIAYGSADAQARLNSLENIREKLDANSGNDEMHQVYLLGIDPDAHNGRAIVAAGNPDYAQNTAVFVPGMNTNLAGVPDQVNRMKQLQGVAEQEASPGDKTAVISWLGYEAPSDLAVTSTHNAEAGAADLRRFTQGIRVAQSPYECSHLTVMGHSYGTTVVGAAASADGGLHADDIIALASPGMDVDHASDLNIDPNHVWIGTARDDPAQEVDGALGAQPVYQDFGGSGSSSTPMGMTVTGATAVRAWRTRPGSSLASHLGRPRHRDHDEAAPPVGCHPLDRLPWSLHEQPVGQGCSAARQVEERRPGRGTADDRASGAGRRHPDHPWPRQGAVHPLRRSQRRDGAGRPLRPDVLRLQRRPARAASGGRSQGS
ncbi:hypothetical protein E6W39_25200 [Kitasatospora acidiphila]|uniref:DUF1023 domain-containing protein n=1 Tax=Kitasatospora acidiphila TaxID=2567942 RepID=A0A540W7M9_9ACTN|nr:alpha/beta hydrolase [Kitasatospora acidiphila]TQF04927.1 hypothetical protein E6W39_25200 [Kitasatospora acidiphila]